MPGPHVDVNVHPTKSEVGFLHQEALIDALRTAVEEKLLASNDRRGNADLHPELDTPVIMQRGWCAFNGPTAVAAQRVCDTLRELHAHMRSAGLYSVN